MRLNFLFIFLHLQEIKKVLQPVKISTKSKGKDLELLKATMPIETMDTSIIASTSTNVTTSSCPTGPTGPQVYEETCNTIKLRPDGAKKRKLTADNPIINGESFLGEESIPVTLPPTSIEVQEIK